MKDEPRKRVDWRFKMQARQGFNLLYFQRGGGSKKLLYPTLYFNGNPYDVLEAKRANSRELQGKFTQISLSEQVNEQIRPPTVHQNFHIVS